MFIFAQAIYMNRTTLEQWRMLIALIDNGGFAQAATAVNKSQSTVHHAVHKLEDMLGIKLIEVKGRKAHLSDRGKVLLKRARYLLEESTKIESMAMNLKSGLESHLKIAVDEAFPQQRLNVALDHVSNQFPQLRVELYETILSGADELLLSNQAGVSISPFPLKNCISEELTTVKFIAVANPSHPIFAEQDALTFETLKSHRQIVLRDSSLASNTSEGWLGSDHRWTVSNLKTSIDLVFKGFGYAWLPEPSIKNYLSSNKLKKLHLAVGSERSVSFYLNVLDWGNLGVGAELFCEQILQG